MEGNGPISLVVQDQRMLKLLMTRDLYLHTDRIPLPPHFFASAYAGGLFASPPATPVSAGLTETGSATGLKGTSEDAGRYTRPGKNPLIFPTMISTNRSEGRVCRDAAKLGLLTRQLWH